MAGVRGGSDGNRGTRESAFAPSCGRSRPAVGVPVTADPSRAGTTCPRTTSSTQCLTAGAVGCNIEDTDHASGHDRCSTPRAHAGYPGRHPGCLPRSGASASFLNARIDAIIRPTRSGDPSAALDEVASRRAQSVLRGGRSTASYPDQLCERPGCWSPESSRNSTRPVNVNNPFGSDRWPWPRPAPARISLGGRRPQLDDPRTLKQRTGRLLAGDRPTAFA